MSIANHVEKKVNEGTLEVEGTKDVPTLALGTPEHGGRVRGVGDGVTPTQYFRLIKRGSKKHPKNKEEKSRLLETNSEPDFMKVHAKEQVIPHFQILCFLLERAGVAGLVWDFKSNVVAKGIVYEELGPETKLHNVPLGQYNSHVAVGKILEGKEQALLPVPVGDKLKFVEDAIGSHVAWPRELVVKANQAITQPTTGHNIAHCRTLQATAGHLQTISSPRKNRATGKSKGDKTKLAGHNKGSDLCHDWYNYSKWST
ncbi:hypothetical protein IFM89_018932 [Coptis chinensis]|uniref:DUF8039 domain-containing protein n=1 Tax=Coptis chinensis TaxID=261450 RepID=A0A835HE34_9MAGN|nr:hypothetical protein IFM89_018932 [Coptis chinensis]